VTGFADQAPGRFFGPSNLVELLSHRAACQGEERVFTFLADGERDEAQLSFAELDRQARAIAARLQARDPAGERALLLYPPGLEFIAALFGCLYAGVVAVPVYPPRRNRSLERLEAVAADAEARVALTTQQVLARVDAPADRTSALGRLTWLATSQVTDETGSAWQPPRVDADTLALLQYTSGSTGTPKGVMLSHGNLIHNSALIAAALEHTRSSSGVFWLPAYHDMGLIGGILQPLYVGRPNVLLSPMSFLQKPYRWLAAVSRYRATTSGGPNFAYDLCLRKITPEERQTLDLSTWQVALSGAEPVRAETLRAFAEAFAPCGFRPEAFYPCYGLAEATLMVSGGFAGRAPVVQGFRAESLAAGKAVPGEPDEDGVRPLVGCGGQLPDQQVVIVDPAAGRACLEGEVGEVWVAGPSVAQGYWRKPELTEATFRARRADTGEGPFLRTGDLGFLYEGVLFPAGRIKDLIIIRGVNHYPQDIEHTVERSHPRLRPGCGAAFTAERDGRQELVVVHEIERARAAPLDEVFQAVRREVSAQHGLTLDAIVLLRAGTTPKTTSGKIQRHACREAFLDGSLRVVGQWHAGETLKGAVPCSLPEDRALPLPDGRRPSKAVDSPVVPRPWKAVVQKTPSFAPGNGESENRDSPRGSEAAKGTVPFSLREDRDSPPRMTRRQVTETVLEEIRRVAKERAAGMTLDSPIAQAGLDSLERMEILASIEERFGGRFPEHVLAEWESPGQLAAAVEKYLGNSPRARTLPLGAPDAPPETYRVECFPEYRELKRNLNLLESSGIGNPFFARHQGVTNDRTVLAGRKVINFSSYNYLGMSGDPAVVEATQAAVARYGTSASASRLVSGEKDLHAELERELADFLGTEDAVVMVGGHATNETVIGHLLGPGDLILHDQLAHNSIIQGAVLSGARRRPFPHNDYRAADRMLRDYRHEYRRVLVVIEGVYSMDGDVPDLPRFVDLKDRHRAVLMIDEAHSVGVLGARGRGIAEHFGVDPAEVEIWMGTLSKSFGSCGGYIAGSAALVEYLKYTAPGFVFAAAIPPPAAAAALASVRLLRREPHRVARLVQNAQQFLSLARAAGVDTGRCQETPVIPVILGNSLDCLLLSKAMLTRGINVMPILHPAVEEKAARLRFFVTSSHTAEQIRYTIDVLAEELGKLNPDYLRRAPEPRAAA